MALFFLFKKKLQKTYNDFPKLAILQLNMYIIYCYYSYCHWQSPWADEKSTCESCSGYTTGRQVKSSQKVERSGM